MWNLSKARTSSRVKCFEKLLWPCLLVLRVMCTRGWRKWSGTTAWRIIFQDLQSSELTCSLLFWRHSACVDAAASSSRSCDTQHPLPQNYNLSLCPSTHFLVKASTAHHLSKVWQACMWPLDRLTWRPSSLNAWVSSATDYTPSETTALCFENRYLAIVSSTKRVAECAQSQVWNLQITVGL